MSLTYKTLHSLKVNPICKPKDYEVFFSVHRNTAQRMLQRDKDLSQKRVYTYLDFFREYEAFPDSNFNAEWLDIKVPK